MKEYPLPPNVEMLPDDVLLYPSTIAFIDGQVEKDPENVRMAEGDYIMARLVKNERVTAHDHFQDVRHIELDVDDPDMNFNPGDVAVLYPMNLPEDVDEFLELLNLSDTADDTFILVPNDEVPPHLNRTLTLRNLFENHLDIFSTPRRSFFEYLSFFTTNEDHTEKLREFCSAEGQDELYAYNQRVRRTIAEVLQDFSSAKIPLEYIPDIFPPLQPRQFSISSFLKVHPGKVHLTVAIVNYKTRLHKPRTGVCTKWLSGLKPGCIIPIKITRGTMKLPASVSTPIILIGPGTGVSVMRAFVQQRVSEGATENYLFFGCRNRDKDYYYKDEWERYAREGQLKVFAAFSRDPNEKIYVQNILKENAQLVWEIVHEREGHIYVSGRSDKMPTDVTNAFKSIFISEGGMTDEDADNYITLMERTGRYQQEVW
ncbi:6116_t:CDS:10 [Acaulospora colombiana]|uniref:6116_t:CDS:1 n=1 Tax=Acaulospora colombiana TaxID=27376 RepID=A0ACA9KMD4_9GLOM|nr:6116_t:CDS:10 [Acaulospora colombiana]